MVWGLLKKLGLQELMQMNCRCLQHSKEYCRFLHKAMSHNSVLNPIHSSHACILPPFAPHPLTTQPSQENSHDVPVPPAKIARPLSGSDVEANDHRAWLRSAVLQSPVIALKMSTALDQTPLPAHTID